MMLNNDLTVLISAIKKTDEEKLKLRRDRDKEIILGSK